MVRVLRQRVMLICLLLCGIGGGAWILTPSMVTDYHDPYVAFIWRAIDEYRLIHNRYPADLKDVQANLERMVAETCRIASAGGNHYRVEIPNQNGKSICVAVTFATKANGILEIYDAKTSDCGGSF